ncbi:MAG: DNA gyrase subunit A [Deltaproteobacteria bacterium]|nr:DNA gyrase subunit A [Deltaproteobacteria bacterium]
MVTSAELIPTNIEDELKGSYLDYAMSVIIGRAIPDIRDGLKPVHRRILYAMYREGLLSSKRYSKCAGVVGEVLKKYHPHGDQAVYDSMVRMAQEWNMRYPLIDGQGNFGSIDGDNAAAYRYTEAKLKRIAEEMLEEIDKETVDFIPNFDGSTEEPAVLPSKIPNLLLNGSDGIAVGMATKIPPHNLTELISAIVALIDNPQTTVKELMKFVPGPDFPTGGFICGREGIKSAYETGRGRVVMRARALIESIARGDKQAIVISEIPFQVNKTRLIERIAELVGDGKLEGISDIRDESDREGIRLVVELKRGAEASIVLNQLYKHTPMEESFGIILLAIVNQQPKVVNLKDALQCFLDHRKEIIIRRTAYDLKVAKERAHILEGLKIALENIDEVIALIKKSKEPSVAKEGLCKKYKLSEIQAQAILDMRLQRLTGLEQTKILEEYKELLQMIKGYQEILASEKLIFKIVKDELLEIKTKYGDERRTEIVSSIESVEDDDLIQEEEMVVTITHGGYIKRNAVSLYRSQNRGGRGKSGMATREEDFVSDLFVASTKNYLLVFSTWGRLYWLKVHNIPQAGRVTKGKVISNLVQLKNGEDIAAILPIKEFAEGHHIVMLTKQGKIKKTDLSEFNQPRASGVIALGVGDGDAMVSARLTDGKQDLIISTRKGKAIRFHETDARPMGRTAAGVRAIKLGKGDEVVSMEALSHEGAPLLAVTEKGYGKRTPVNEYRVQSRGGTGIFTCKITEKNGDVVGVMQVNEGEDIMLVTNGGKIIRTAVSGISLQGRATQGVRLMSMESDEKIMSFARLAEKDEEQIPAGKIGEKNE